MTHIVAQKVILIALSLIGAWSLYALRRRDRHADGMTRGLSLVGIVLMLLMATNEAVHLVNLADCATADARMEVPTCAK